MEISIRVRSSEPLPTIEVLESIMWKSNASISRVGSDELFRKGVRIEIDDDAPFVDNRAVILLAKFILENNGDEISFDQEKWLRKISFIEKIKII